ncbi:MAG: S1 RNA-binding domain-containing protein [Flavobacteriaceae bacterium]
MIEIGAFNNLKILRDTDPGLFLGDDEDNEVLLPNRYVPQDFNIGDDIDVFVYLDNEERLVAVTDKPHIKKGDFALLRCNAISDFGAFLDWGMVKELFCPFKEQAFKMVKGGWYLVYCYLDEKTNRLVASSKTNRFLDNSELTVSLYDEVDLIVSHPSEIGMNVIVNKTHLGLVYSNSIFQDLNIGDQLKGVVKKIRPGNKLDISLQKIGYRNIEPSAQLLLDLIHRQNGFLNINDKSSPETIKSVAQMSKKSFKKAIGALYKQRLIRLEADGIYLVTA